MFSVNEYKIVFKRRWHKDRVFDPAGLKWSGRYDTVCEIYHTSDKCKVSSESKQIIYRLKPSFTGIARLHPNDRPDKIVGKKIALRKAMGEYNPETECLIYNCADFYNKSVRTAIWKAFRKWVKSWTERIGEDL